MRRALLLTVAVAAVGAALTLASPAIAGGGGVCQSDATEATGSMVELRKTCFTPTLTRVDPGQEVAFGNRDGLTHNIVGLGARWGDVNGMSGGETRRFMFNEAGVYPYSCTLHVGMVGAVVVGDNDLHAGDAGGVVATSSSGSGGATSAGARESAPQTRGSLRPRSDSYS